MTTKSIKNKARAKRIAAVFAKQNREPLRYIAIWQKRKGMK